MARTDGEVAIVDPKMQQLLKELALSGVAITAGVDIKGRLHKVGGEFEKLLAAARERSLPRIHTVVVAEAQREDVKRIDPTLLEDNPHAEFRIICAHTLEEAVRLLVDAQTRWGDIIDCTVELDRHRHVVGRHWLQEKVQTLIAARDSGYLLLTGGPGIGKSAFVAAQVQQGLQPVVSHFIKRGMGNWDDLDAILRSLTAQLRRKYALAHTSTGTRLTPSEKFINTLQQMSSSLEAGQKEVIYLDGLDEAFGPTGRFAQVPLPGILPLMLPSHIVMVLTSRPGEFLNWLANPTLCEPIPLDPNAAANREDIRTYLRQQNLIRSLKLDEDFIEKLLTASEGIFAVAVLYLRQRVDLHAELNAWQEDPSRIPKGLNGWLTEQWQHLVHPLPSAKPASRRRQSPPSPEIIRGVLGLLALAREPLSRNHLLTFLAGDSKKQIGFLHVREVTRHLDRVLRLAQEFFDPLDPSQGSAALYRFFHTYFPEFVATQLSEAERQDLHRLFAQGCAQVMRTGATRTGKGHDQQRTVRDYALRHWLAHLIVTQDWQEIARAFADTNYIVERSERFGFADVHTDALAAAQAPIQSQAWQEAFITWERFLRWRIERLRHTPTVYPQEIVNEFLTNAPGVFASALAQLRVELASHATLILRKVFGGPALREAGHGGGIESVAFAPDGHRVASGSVDGTVKLWEAQTGRLVADCRGHQGGVWSVAFAPDGHRVASGSWDKTVKVWEAATGRMIADWGGIGEGVWSVAFSPDGQWVASGSEDGMMKVREATTGQLVADCTGHRRVVRSVAFSPDGRWVVSGAWDRTVKVWEATTGQLVADYVGHRGGVRSVAFSPDGQWVASGSEDGMMKMWTVQTGRCINTLFFDQALVEVAFFAREFLGIGQQ